MDKEVLTQLLEEWIKEIQVEIKSIKEDINSLKEENIKVSYFIQSFENKKNECEKIFDRFENKFSELEKKDSKFINDIIKSDGCLKSAIDKADLEKKHSDESLKSFKTDMEKSLTKIKDNVNWLWRTIVVLALGIIAKFLF
jgi:predicted nuclease with TOPRIM domain